MPSGALFSENLRGKGRSGQDLWRSCPRFLRFFPVFPPKRTRRQGKFLRKEKVSAEVDFHNRRLPQKFSEGGNLPGEGKPFSEKLRGKGRSGQDLIGIALDLAQILRGFLSFFSEDRKNFSRGSEKTFLRGSEKPFRGKNLVRNFRPKFSGVRRKNDPTKTEYGACAVRHSIFSRRGDRPVGPPGCRRKARSDHGSRTAVFCRRALQSR